MFYPLNSCFIVHVISFLMDQISCGLDHISGRAWISNIEIAYTAVILCYLSIFDLLKA